MEKLLNELYTIHNLAKANTGLPGGGFMEITTEEHEYLMSKATVDCPHCLDTTDKRLLGTFMGVKLYPKD